MCHYTFVTPVLGRDRQAGFSTQLALAYLSSSRPVRCLESIEPGGRHMRNGSQSILWPPRVHTCAHTSTRAHTHRYAHTCILSHMYTTPRHSMYIHTYSIHTQKKKKKNTGSQVQETCEHTLSVKSHCYKRGKILNKFRVTV